MVCWLYAASVLPGTKTHEAWLVHTRPGLQHVVGHSIHRPLKCAEVCKLVALGKAAWRIGPWLGVLIAHPWAMTSLPLILLSFLRQCSRPTAGGAVRRDKARLAAYCWLLGSLQPLRDMLEQLGKRGIRARAAR